MKKLYIRIVLTGILLSLGWPTYGFPLLLFFALVPLLDFVDIVSVSKIKRKNITVFLYSFVAFFIWNIVTTWWIYNSTEFGAAFAIICNTSFFAILITIYHWSLKRLPRITASIFLITLWLAFEKLHLTWDFSWPWLNLGNGFSDYIYWIQWYEYTGAFGGSLWVLVLNFFFFNCYRAYKSHKNLRLLFYKSVPGLLGIALPIAISMIIYINIPKNKNTTEVVVIQPNIDPYIEKYNLDNQYFTNLFISLSKGYLTKSTNYILAPETYFTEGNGFDIDYFEKSKFNNSLKKNLASHPELNLIAGTQFYKIYRAQKAPTQSANEIQKGYWVDFYNSAIQVAPNIETQIYHKSKLVVGVENMPYKGFFKPLLGEIMIDLGGTISSRAVQKERVVFAHSTNKIKTAPIICWESVYGEYLTEYTRKGADFFSIITNDAWWGNTEGHKQFLSYTRLRAIENRRAIARSANTGISAFINTKGEIISSLKYGLKGTLKSNVPLNTKLTFYAKYGDYIARWSIFLCFLFFCVALSGRFKMKK